MTLSRTRYTTGLNLFQIVETLDLTTPAASHALTATLPVGAVVQAAIMTFPVDVTGAGSAVKVGLGRSTAVSDPDKYLLSSVLTADTVRAFGQHLEQSIADTNGEALSVYACDTNGDALGTIGGAGETAEVTVIYAVPQPLN